MSSIHVDAISKKYGTVKAVDSITFTVDKGQIFGIIGPDGAGKTTLFRILSTLILPDSGSATVCDLDIVRDFKKIRHAIGYMPGRFSLYQDLTVEENLTIFATVFNTTVRENYDLIRDIYQHIEPFKKRRAGDLSGGMKQKLALSCSLIHKPSVLFLDEPTTGVDPVSRRELWDMLRNIKKLGISILVSTPYMDEATACDTIALMNKGSFFKIDTPQNIVRSFHRKIFAVRSENMYRLLKDIRELPFVHTCYAFGDAHHVTFKDPSIGAETLAGHLSQKDHCRTEIHEIDATIEDYFMEYMR